MSIPRSDLVATVVTAAATVDDDDDDDDGGGGGGASVSPRPWWPARAHEGGHREEEGSIDESVG